MKKIIFALIITAGFLSSVAAQTVKKPIKSTPVTIKPDFAKGKLVYTKHCMACHQIDGGGVMGLNPPLNKTEYVLGDQKRLINIVLKGFNQEIEIDGDTYANPMPALNYLSDQQIADVLSYVRNNLGNKASIITADQVKKVRASKP
ncbi:MAG: cytochrome c [Bacteroidota bacterium]